MPLLIYKTRILSLKDIEARLEPPFGGGGEESVYLLKYSIISRKKKVVFTKLRSCFLSMQMML